MRRAAIGMRCDADEPTDFRLDDHAATVRKPCARRRGIFLRPAAATDVWKCNAAAVTLRPVTLRAFLFLLTAIAAFAQGEGSALDALRLIPKDAAKRLARIEAREGAPAPERWYLLVYEPVEKRGLR